MSEPIAAFTRAATVVRSTGTAKATGNTLNLAAVHLWDVFEGKVARFRLFIDTAKFLEAVPAEVARSYETAPR